MSFSAAGNPRERESCGTQSGLLRSTRGRGVGHDPTSTRSDVDFLVSLDERRSLLDLGGLLMDLRDALGCEVDVVTDTGLRERIRDDVLAIAAPP